MSAPTGLEWGEADVVRLRQLWAEGLTATDIAAALGKGTTRSAVLGKVHRLKLPQRRTTGVQSLARMEALTRKLAAPASQPARRGTPGLPKPMAMVDRVKRRQAPIDEDASELRILKSNAWKPLPGSPVPRRLEELESSQCKWPIGDGPILFCGQERGEHRCYCDAHARVAEPTWKAERHG